MEKGGIVLFEQMQGESNMGSSRIRGHWLIRAWNEDKTIDSSLEVFQQGAKYDFIIFQKAYWLEYAEKFKGIKILDICDPDWLAGSCVKRMTDCVDGVTTSSQVLADSLKEIVDKPIKFIPDRQDLEFHPFMKKHEGRAKWVCWFGYSHNAEELYQVTSSLKKLNLKLKVISNCRPPSKYADENVQYDWKNPDFDFNKEVTKCDIVIMPAHITALGKYKSLNKTYTSWALGMPVANSKDDLERFLDAGERNKEAEKRIKEVREKFDIRLSVKEFSNFIKQLKEKKK